jgi:hypothetical protein
MVGGSWRGYFAPFNAALAVANTSTQLGPVILDLQTSGPFVDTALPYPYTDMGWIDSFKITPSSKIGTIRSGYRGAARAKFRGEVSETFDFQFREMTRVAMRIATGTEVFNLLLDPNAQSNGPNLNGPLSASGGFTQALGASGYIYNYNYNGAIVSALFVPTGSGAAYSPGDMIVCDADYTGAYGLTGSNATNVFQGAVTDIDFTRKTSDFIARVKQVVPTIVTGQDGLILNKPFAGGGSVQGGITAATTASYGPPAGSKIQKIKGYVAREGGSAITEWSGLFLMNCIDGSQIALYYPHIAPSAFKDFANYQIENIGTSNLTGMALDCTMEAMAYDDPIDGETVVRYAAFYPAPGIDPQS